jgi:zinc transporter 9
MAIILIIKNRAFLLGKAIPAKLRKEIIELIESDPIIDKVLDFKSSILDVDVYHIKCEIECNGTAMMKELGKNNYFRNEYEDIKDDYQDFLSFCVDFTGRLPRLLGTRIDEIELHIKEKFPQVRHIDLEIN